VNVLLIKKARRAVPGHRASLFFVAS